MQALGNFVYRECLSPLHDFSHASKQLAAVATRLQMLINLDPLRLADRTFQVVRHEFFATYAIHRAIFPNTRANSARPRLILDFTVPKGSFNISAISS